MNDIFYELLLLKKKKFLLLKDKVNYIVNNNINEKNEIELVLDHLLDVCFDDESIEFYYYLCDYYETIDKKNSDFYRKELKKFL